MKKNDPEELIDLDQDGLDDRLIQVKIGDDDTIRDVLDRLNMLQLHMLPVDTLDQMIKNVEDEKKELWNKARAIENSVHEDLVQGNYSALGKMRRKCGFYRRSPMIFPINLTNYKVRQHRI